MRSTNDFTGPAAHALAAAVATAPDAQRCFRDLLGNVNLIAVTIDREARITYCNEFFLRLTGWSFQEIEGRNWHEVFVPPTIEDLRPLFADLFRDLPGTWHHENDIFTRAGERRSIRWNNILLRDSLGNPVGAGSIGEDITDRKQLESALQDCNARERGDLEKELHDGLGQELVGIALLARSLATSASRDHMDIANDLRRLSLLASSAVESCRKIARGFAPFSEPHGGLIHAIKQLAVVPSEWRGPIVEFAVSQSAPLSLSVEACDHLYHLAMDGLNNAVKHAGATAVKIGLQIQATSVILSISDNGIEAADTAADAPAANMKMMQHRAALLKGALRFESDAEKGSRLVVTCSQPSVSA